MAPNISHVAIRQPIALSRVPLKASATPPKDCSTTTTTPIDNDNYWTWQQGVGCNCCVLSTNHVTANTIRAAASDSGAVDVVVSPDISTATDQLYWTEANYTLDDNAYWTDNRSTRTAVDMYWHGL